MKIEEVLHRVLGVEAPWQVVKVRDDLGRKQIDIWLGKASGRASWFFGQRQVAASGPEFTWRHVNIGDCRCVIHAPADESGNPPAWSGEPSLPFTYGMSRMIASMMRAGVNLQHICDLLDVAVADIWKFKHTLDNGKANLSVASKEVGAPASRVPDATEPVWGELLDGSLQIEIKLLSLKLLLAKLREQMKVISDPEVRTLKVCELQRYFQRYEASLGHELEQLERWIGRRA